MRWSWRDWPCSMPQSWRRSFLSHFIMVCFEESGLVKECCLLVDGIRAFWRYVCTHLDRSWSMLWRGCKWRELSRRWYICWFSTNLVANLVWKFTPFTYSRGLKVKFHRLSVIIQCVLDNREILVERIQAQFGYLSFAKVAVWILVALVFRDWLGWIAPLQPVLYLCRLGQRLVTNPSKYCVGSELVLLIHVLFIYGQLLLASSTDWESPNTPCMRSLPLQYVTWLRLVWVHIHLLVAAQIGTKLLYTRLCLESDLGW